MFYYGQCKSKLCCSRYYELAGLLRELEAVKKSKELNEIAKVCFPHLHNYCKTKHVTIWQCY